MKLKTTVHIFIMMLLVSSSLKGQDKISFAKADSITYNSYLKGNWDEVIKTGKVALRSGVDYYYLHMRMGFAYFQKQQYRLAVRHYECAMKYSSDDITAIYYLLLSYENGARMTDALALSGKVDSIQQPQIYNKYKKNILGGGVSYTYNSSGTDEVKDALNNKNINTSGVQKAPNSYNLISTALSHRIGRHIFLSHQFSHMRKDEFSTSLTNGFSYKNENQIVTQNNYNLKATITLSKGVALVPVYNFVSVRIPFDDLNIDAYTEKSTVYGAMLKKQSGLLELGVSYILGKVNSIHQTQRGGHLTFYPKGNHNLYYSFSGFIQTQEFNNSNETTFIHKHLLGFKAMKRWWIETSLIPVKFSNFYNPESGVLNNDLNATKSVFNLTNYLFVGKKRTSFFVNFGMVESVSEFIDQNNRPLPQEGEKTYKNINITAGISWKL